MSSFLNPLSDGIGADIIFLSELIRGDVILQYLSHDGLLLGLGHRVRADHGSDKGRLDTSQRYVRVARMATWLDIRNPGGQEKTSMQNVVTHT